jgi:hypothetical protein
LYPGAFFAGQVQQLIRLEPSVMFNEIKAAFLERIRGTDDAVLAEPDRLPLYMVDVTAGLEIGANYPVTTVRAGQTARQLNPLAVTWHHFPGWLRARLRWRFGPRVELLDGFSRIVSSIRGMNLFESCFDHWGSDRTDRIFISEPYNYSTHDEEAIREFCETVKARYRIRPHPFHHPNTTRIEMGMFLKGEL